MSESSSEQGANSKKRTVAQLVDRLRAKTSTERLSLMAHLSVVIAWTGVDETGLHPVSNANRRSKRVWDIVALRGAGNQRL